MKALTNHFSRMYKQTDRDSLLFCYKTAGLIKWMISYLHFCSIIGLNVEIYIQTYISSKIKPRRTYRSHYCPSVYKAYDHHHSIDDISTGQSLCNILIRNKRYFIYLSFKSKSAQEKERIIYIPVCLIIDWYERYLLTDEGWSSSSSFR